jgi:hypothetical protein
VEHQAIIGHPPRIFTRDSPGMTWKYLEIGNQAAAIAIAEARKNGQCLGDRGLRENLATRCRLNMINGNILKIMYDYVILYSYKYICNHIHIHPEIMSSRHEIEGLLRPICLKVLLGV